MNFYNTKAYLVYASLILTAAKKRLPEQASCAGKSFYKSSVKQRRLVKIPVGVGNPMAIVGFGN